ncbi:MAG: hypothetical protein LAP13_23340 [Acidobacteriia bacterium]|nr:hypothetical protein [Terriglobia bacterium]
MDIAERRAMQEFQNRVYPDLKRKIDDAAGFAVAMEVNWESLAVPNEADIYHEFWTKIYFEPLIEAFRSLCADDVGKEALKHSLTKIEILNSGERFDENAYAFEGGVLRIDHKLSNVDWVQLRVDAIVSLLRPPTPQAPPRREVKINIHESMKEILKRHEGKQVRIHLKTGSELEGNLTEVGDEVLHLTELSGMEYYDAIVRIASISAVILRAKR